MSEDGNTAKGLYIPLSSGFLYVMFYLLIFFFPKDYITANYTLYP